MGKRTKSKATVTAITALILAAGIAGAAHAASDDDAYERPREESASTEPGGDTTVLPVEEILARLHTAGYTDIREVERDRGRYEVKGRDTQGQRVELYVDAHTGEVLKEDHDD